VRRGRTAEFESFSWQGEIADPQADSTFAASRLKHVLAQGEPHRTLLRFYQMLMHFRKEHALGHAGPPSVKEFASSKALAALNDTRRNQILLLFNFGDASADLADIVPDGKWEKKIDSSDLAWLGPGISMPSAMKARPDPWRCSHDLLPYSNALSRSNDAIPLCSRTFLSTAAREPFFLKLSSCKTPPIRITTGTKEWPLSATRPMRHREFWTASSASCNW